MSAQMPAETKKLIQSISPVGVNPWVPRSAGGEVRMEGNVAVCGKVAAGLAVVAV